MILRFTFATVFLVSVLMIGCTDGPAITDSSVPTERGQLSHLLEYGVPDGVDPLPPVAGHYPEIAPSDLQSSSNAAAAYYFEAMKLVKKADSWQSADPQLRDMLSKHGDELLPRYVKEQIIASAMFRGTAILDDITQPIEPERREAIEYFLSLLIDNNSPDMLIVRRGLEATRASWDVATWRTVANKAATARTLYDLRLKSLKNCEDCSGKIGIDMVADRLPEGFAEQVENYRARQISAAESLQEMAKTNQ